MNKSPSEIPIPESMELAKLAAILRPNAEAADALEVAMKFYVEAVHFRRECASKSLDDLITEFGSNKRQMQRYFALANEPIKEADETIKAQFADTLELDFEKDDDPVREYLAQHGLRLKRAQSVLDNFRRYYNSLPSDPAWSGIRWLPLESVIAKFERGSGSKKTYAIPKFLLDNVIKHALTRRKEAKRESARKTRQIKSSVRSAK